MNALETVLVFVAIPLVVLFGTYAVVVGFSRTATPRYRPGRRMEFTPVWYLAPEVAAGESSQAALPAGVDPGANGAHAAPSPVKGGARGSW